MSADSLKRTAPLLGFALLLLAEFLLFDQIGARHHTWVYPRWNDQVQYLTEAYLGHEDAKANGVAPALVRALLNPSAQGTLHDVAAIAIFSVAGPSRSAALSLNMLAFLAWQIALFAWAVRFLRSYAAAFLGVALLLVLKSAWVTAPGSAFDFRLDWFTVCGTGLALVAALWTDGFRRRGAALVFGAVVGGVLITRFLTGAYFFVIYAALLARCLSSAERTPRCVNLLLSAAVAAAVAAPIFWVNREPVFNYYLVGHFVGPESGLRSLHLGFLASTRWVFERFALPHAGASFFWLAAACACGAVVTALLWPARPKDKSFNVTSRSLPYFPAAVFFAAPLLVLILHVQKTPQVLGVLLPGLATLVFLLLWQLLGASRAAAQSVIATGAVLVAMTVFCWRILPDPHPPRFRQLARQTLALANHISTASAEAGLVHPRIAVDRVTDNLDAQIFRVVCYERQGHWIPFIMTLPTGLSAERPELYWERLENSDFVFLTLEGDRGRWPYDHQLADLRPATLAWADRTLRRVEEFSQGTLRMALFERRDLQQDAAGK